MDTNIAAWMIAGGPRITLHATERDRDQLHALRESQHAAAPAPIGLVERLRSLARPQMTAPDAACCAA